MAKREDGSFNPDDSFGDFVYCSDDDVAESEALDKMRSEAIDFVGNKRMDRVKVWSSRGFLTIHDGRSVWFDGGICTDQKDGQFSGFWCRCARWKYAPKFTIGCA